MQKQQPPHNAQQIITLYDRSNESASGHTETHQSASLEIDSNGNVILREECQHLEYLHPHNDVTINRNFKIKIETLVELIKKHGQLAADQNKKKKSWHLRVCRKPYIAEQFTAHSVSLTRIPFHYRSHGLY